MPEYVREIYRPPFIFRNRHLHTIIPSLFRRVKVPSAENIRLTTPDHDFLDIDYYKNNGKVVAIINHGLEGNSRKPYVLGTVKYLLNSDFDAIAINLKGCSGYSNRLLTSYHAGKTDDLDIVIKYAIKVLKYPKIVLIGFSLGGNITMKYIGESGKNIYPEIKVGIAISVPCNLKSSAYQLGRISNSLYLIKFIRSLKKKALKKINDFNIDYLPLDKIRRAKDFFHFDNLFTAPVHGFSNAEEYWSKCSSIQFIPDISVPTLLISALDDPFLSSDCFPNDLSEKNPQFFLYTPRYGGHVGFTCDLLMKKPFLFEKIIIEFCRKYMII